MSKSTLPMVELPPRRGTVLETECEVVSGHDDRPDDQLEISQSRASPNLFNSDKKLLSDLLGKMSNWDIEYAKQKCYSGIWTGRGGNDPISGVHQFLDRQQIAELLASKAVDNCDTCNLLRNTIHCLYPEGVSDVDAIGGWQPGARSFFGFYLNGPKKYEQIELFVVGAGKSIPSTESRLDIRTRRHPAGETSSKASLEWSRRWLDICINQHPHCVPKQEARLPSRVIDLFPDGLETCRGAVRLVDGGQDLPFARYAALSHCWGHVLPECITTTATIKDRKQSIKFESLPKTFQDAVDFTRGLQVRYLWIDSLCIVQDDEADWRHECTQMERVYGNSFVTLASVHAKDCNGGLFAALPECFAYHIVGEVESGGKMLDILARRTLPYIHNWRSDHESGAPPLFSRAWAYQERMVAPRVIYFTNCELLWGCFERTGCECFGGAPDGEQYGSNPKLLHASALENCNVVGRWMEIVEEYSRLDLTKYPDKLPAISAIAKQIQQHRPNDRYLAGLWYDTLLDELLWLRIQWVKPPAPRPLEYIAPTWSWASIHDGVNYEANMKEIGQDPIKRPRILSANCQYRENDGYGQATSGTLVFWGKLVKCSINLSKTPITLEHTTVGEMEFTADPGIYHSFYQDCTLEPNGNLYEYNDQARTVYLLNLFERQDIICCLVLVKLLDQDVYHRVGATVTCIPTLRPAAIVKGKEQLVQMFAGVQESHIVIM